VRSIVAVALVCCATRSLSGQVTASSAAPSPAPTSASAYQPSPESAVYRLVRRSVFKVQAGAATGSGFLIDSLGGLIVTNQHVIDEAQPDEISVMVDSVTRVPARVVAADHDADLALLRVHPDFLTGRSGLAVAVADSDSSVVQPGEHVLAVGFPLNQRMSVTTGIVSSVRHGAITSDARINHGNSGGPLLNLRGQVVGVNTFLETDEGTAGVTGAVSLAPLGALIDRARAVVESSSLPAKRLLPLLPSATFPIAVLRQAADSVDPVYDAMASLDVDNFLVSIATPVSTLASITQVEKVVWGARRKRELRAPVVSRDQLRQFAPYRDWEEYVGDETAPAVIIEVVPKVGRTTGTSIANILGAVAAGLSRTAYIPGTQHMEFKGDVEWVRFYRNGEPIVPVIGGRTPQRVLVSNGFVEMRDVAYRGIYVLQPDVFAPDSSGRPPSVMIVVGDLVHPTDFVAHEVPAAVASRVWNDFLPYFRATGHGDERPARSTKTFVSLESGFCDSHDCTGGDPIESGPAAGVRIAGWATEGGGVLVGWAPHPSSKATAALQPGDLIVSVDGHAYQNVPDVVVALERASAPPRILYRRGNRYGWVAEGADSVLTGLQLDAEESGTSGVRIARVTRGSAAATAGIRSGDRLVTVDGEAVRDLEQLDELVQRNPSGHWRLGIQRGQTLSEVTF